MCELCPAEANVLALMTENSIIDASRTYSTPADVNMVASCIEQYNRKKIKRSGNKMDRVHKCETENCQFLLRYKVRLVAVNDHGYQVEDQKNNESVKQLRYVMTKFTPHNCSDENIMHFGTFYSSSQLAPILVKLSKNSNLPSYDVCKTALSPYVRGEVS